MDVVLGETDTEFRPWFEEMARRRSLVLRRCTTCGLLRHPPGAGCPWCGSLEWEWGEVSGRGTIYSYEVVTQAIQPGFRDWLPYAVVLVELDEQRDVPESGHALRLVGNLLREDGSPEEEANVAIGLRVDVVFREFTEGLLLPQFRLTEEASAGRVWRL